MNQLKKIWKGQKGFTLVEMLIVLFIIGALLLIIVPSLSGTGSEAQAKACDANKKMLTNALETYKLENGGDPESIEDLEESEYIDHVPHCPAGEQHVYGIENGEITCSYGH